MKPWCNGLFLLIIPLCSAIDTITPTRPLGDNETLVSSNGLFALGFFTPDNSNNRYIGLWYNQISVQKILWVANRDDPVFNSKGTLGITINGNLTIANQNSRVIWSTNTTGLANPIAKLLDTGNFVVKEDGSSSESYAWQGFDYPTDTLIPGMKLGVNYATGHSWILRAWRSNNDPSSGEQSLAMDLGGDLEMYLYIKSLKEWRSGPWDGIQFNKMAGTVFNFGTDERFSFVNTSEEVAYSYQVTNESDLHSRLVVNESGSVQHWIWGRNQWNISWYAPKDKCDQIGRCGPNGICNPLSSPICSCLPGFAPNYPADWLLVHGSTGCYRKTELSCQNGTTDDFMVVKEVKLPDGEYGKVTMRMSLDECKVLCLSNCNCTAYAGFNDSMTGGGCITWEYELSDIKQYNGTGHDLYVRLAAAEPGASPIKSDKGRIKVVAIIVSVLFGILLLSCVYWFLRKKKKRREGHNNFFNGGGNPQDLPIVDFYTIAAATDHFSDGNKLGEGGFGPVYKGKLGEDQNIAVKRLSKTSRQGVDEFKNEVKLISKLQHRNLVRLLGCCIEGDERMLIYEYMPNKSIDAFLFGNDKITLLSWRTRYRIILGIARGLLYLHQDSRFRIIHRDLKAGNILLDKDMNPKISDFGMARIFVGDETDFNTKKVVGTHGYMSPEYALEGAFSMKSDIFSFGVLVLEIISGKKNRGLYAFSPHLNLLAHAWSLWSEGDILQLVQEGMSSAPTNVILKCIKIGLLCVQERPEDRPLMSNVIEMFGSDTASLPQPNPPGFVSRFGPLAMDREEQCSLNGASITQLSGR